MWKVYKLVNSALSECYVGVTDGDPQDNFREAANGGVEVIDHWDAEDHRIRMEILQTFPDEMSAVSYLGEIVDKDHCLKSV